MIDLVKIRHHYGARPVLRDVSLRVSRGEVIALMGPNGMGKSTLLGVAAGVLWSLEGHVEIDGIRRRSSEEAELAIRQRVAFLPAEPWLPISKTGREWLLAVGRLYGVDDRRLLAHVDRLLDLFDLNDRADSVTAAYSTGQRKKLALCAALVTDAPILMLDEPFAGGLDPSGILAFKRILQHHAKQRDRTILLATPVPELVDEIADRVALIVGGEIIAFETPAELKRRTNTSTLAEAYEQLASPETLAKIDRYFANESMRGAQ
jgi:ABC-type multidrug transport system ATPase subunit